MYFEQKAVVQHVHKKGAIKSNYPAAKIKTISYRNQLYFTITNITDQTLLQQFLFNIPKNILIAIKNGDWPFLKAVKEVSRNISKIRQSRDKKQAHPQKLRDDQILALFN
jgi:hypothetical protein